MPSHLRNRLLAHWPLKLALGTALTVVFCAGYFALEYYPWRPATEFELTSVDRAVPFAPGWVWVYQSVYLLLPLAWLCESTAQLRRYARGFVLVMLIGFTCFLLWPVAGPRPTAFVDEALYRLLVGYDTTANSFPSLHMALATYSACTASAVTAGALRRWLNVLLPLWVALIGYATLATKQHYWVDLPPGITLGWLAHWWAWRSSSTATIRLAERGAL
ncbi:MAG: phosphatase PAP2 family protein [Acidobacteria bacterium]|nr:phosphatase PAP2 family protein [Acidobacteriota bacterium]MBI3423600.1 phosphatase PAP2 family protein [Acidobacteriota bacterium]